jgi:UDP-glucose 4-epimerase
MKFKMTILLPGGAGYIGSHTAVELLNSGYDIIILDNFINSKKDVLENIKKITGKDFKFFEIDYRKKDELSKIFYENKIDAVLNFAGYKAVGESVENPLKYYDNNLFGAINLLEVMKEYNVKKFVFSSSATVYGDQGVSKMNENLSRGKTTNPYGTTKAMIEKILEDLYTSDNSWDICILRYFNPVRSTRFRFNW